MNDLAEKTNSGTRVLLNPRTPLTAQFKHEFVAVIERLVLLFPKCAPGGRTHRPAYARKRAYGRDRFTSKASKAKALPIKSKLLRDGAKKMLN